MSIDIPLDFVKQSLGVVQQKTGPEIRLSGNTCTACEIDLLQHVLQPPVAFARVKEINAQSRCNGTSVAVFLPVKDKRIEIIFAKVNHGEHHVLDAFLYPLLRILKDFVASIPAA